AAANRLQVVSFRLMANGPAEAVTALGRPPATLDRGEIATSQLPGAGPFEIEERGQYEINPALHADEIPEPIMVEAEHRFQLFEEQLDLPAKRIPFDELRR